LLFDSIAFSARQVFSHSRGKRSPEKKRLPQEIRLTMTANERWVDIDLVRKRRSRVRRLSLRFSNRDQRLSARWLSVLLFGAHFAASRTSRACLISTLHCADASCVPPFLFFSLRSRHWYTGWLCFHALAIHAPRERDDSLSTRTAALPPRDTAD